MEDKMGKKIIVLILVLITSSLWAKYPFSEKSEEEILNQSEKVNLLIEGKVTNVEQVYIDTSQKIKRIVQHLENQNISNLWIYTKLEVEVLNTYKNENNTELNIINVWILGGVIYVNSTKKFIVVSNSAYPFLNIGDIMLMGLEKNNPNKSINSLIESYQDGYHFFSGIDLQIPSSDNMINIVEEGELEKAKKDIYLKKLKALERNNNSSNSNNQDSDFSEVFESEEELSYLNKEFPSYEEIEFNLLTANEKKLKKIKERKNFVKKVKSLLRRKYD
jgi:hypothetical protein